ncbi:hypothetical protein GQ42DRAFT_154461 [Ramicandelaber brevisporus]|nr:hypothetical protein GQ42DRAFT_154461 [Ramicandelaber brevisporus]
MQEPNHTETPTAQTGSIEDESSARAETDTESTGTAIPEEEQPASPDDKCIDDGEQDSAASASKTAATGEFSCNICFDTANHPVLTVCGHLFCWPCLHQWLVTQPSCPVCKAGCEREKVIPVYGRGKEAKDPRLEELPSRPRGQRPDPIPSPNAGFRFGARRRGPGGAAAAAAAAVGPFQFHGGGQLAFGFFPGLFGATYTFGGGGGNDERLEGRERLGSGGVGAMMADDPALAAAMMEHDAALAGMAVFSPTQTFLSRLGLMVGILVMIALFTV